MTATVATLRATVPQHLALRETQKREERSKKQRELSRKNETSVVNVENVLSEENEPDERDGQNAAGTFRPQAGGLLTTASTRSTP